MSLDRQGLFIVCVNGMITAFTEQKETIAFKISDQIASFDGQLYLDRYLLDERPSRRDFFLLLAISLNHLAEGVSEHLAAIFKCLALSYHLWPFYELPHISRPYLSVFGGICIQQYIHLPLLSYIRIISLLYGSAGAAASSTSSRNN